MILKPKKKITNALYNHKIKFLFVVFFIFIIADNKKIIAKKVIKLPKELKLFQKL